jgi:hypothetical protein
MDDVCWPETLVSTYKSTLLYNPEAILQSRLAARLNTAPTLHKIQIWIYTVVYMQHKLQQF